MKKSLVLSLSLFLLCGCASQNIDSSEDKKDEAKTTAVTTTARTTSSSTVTTSHTITTTIATPTSVAAETTSIADADDFVWLERGVYEVGYGERKPDLPYDNRFEGVFYSFLMIIQVLSGMHMRVLSLIFLANKKKTVSFFMKLI